jgi:uncharacterized protein involved in exopolysaccharide biosynthesis
MGPIQTLAELASLIWRRRLLIAAVTVACLTVVVLYASSRPRVYMATSVIQVETPLISDANGAILPGNSAQRIQSIQQRLTTREAMLALAARHGLFAGVPLTDDQKVVALRYSIDFVPVASAAQGSYGTAQISALIINARADTGDQAARVANDLAQGVLDASVENQAARAREAYGFFVEEERRLGSEIEAVEAEMSAYRNAHNDSLPQTAEARRTEMTQIDAEVRQLDQTMVELDNEAARIGQGRSLRASEQQQIDALAAQQAVLRSQREQLLARRVVLAEALAEGPEVERTLGAMQRRLELLQAEYAGVTRRKAEAETAQKLEERQQAERFTLLERAVTPAFPVSGGRKRIVMAGAVASLMAALGLAFLLDLLNPVLRTRGQFARDVGITPIAAIPDMPNLRRPRRPALVPTRPDSSAATALQPLWERFAPAEVLRAVLSVPRPALGAGLAVVLVVVAMAVA